MQLEPAVLFDDTKIFHEMPTMKREYFIKLGVCSTGHWPCLLLFQPPRFYWLRLLLAVLI